MTNTPLNPAETPTYRPLVWPAVALVVGILVADRVAAPPAAWLVAGAGAAGAWTVCHVLHRGRAALGALMILVACVGAGRYAAATRPPARDVARVAGDPPRLVRLEGVVVRPVRERPPPADVFVPRAPEFHKTSFTVRAESVRVGGRRLPAGGEVSVGVNRPLADAPKGPPQLGDRVEVVGRLGQWSRPTNPGVFDAGAYLRRQGVRAYLTTDVWEAVRVTEPGADPLRSGMGTMRRWAVRRLRRIPSAEARAVVSAIVFGRRDLMAAEAGPEIERTFHASGTGHFLAVSGLHVGLVAAVVLLAARGLGLGPRTTAVGVAAVVGAYALMTDLRPSVVRATILVWILCLGWFVARRPVFGNSLAAAGIVVLLLRPADLFSMGFQLSFGVVIGLLLLSEKIETSVLRKDEELDAIRQAASPRTTRWWGWGRRMVSFALAAAMISIPLIALRTHLVAWLAPVGSLLLFPLVFALFASGMVLVCLGWPAEWLGDLLAAVPDGLGRAIAGVARGLASVPGGHFYVPQLHVGWVAAWYGVLLVWAMRRSMGLSRRRLAIVALAAAAGFFWTARRSPPEHVRAAFLDVGSGNANLVELPGGEAVLYDAGSSLVSAFEAEWTTCPALWARGITHLDAVFLSHAHFDHFKDLLPIVDRFGVRRVYVPPTFVRRRLAMDDAVIEELLARGVEVRFFGPGDRLDGADGTRIEALWPRGPAAQTHEINDGSLVLRVAGGPRRLLLTGDLETPGIAGLLAEDNVDLAADVILWPHHGGDAEDVGRLAERCGAKVLVVSTGWRGAPAPAWAERLGTEIYRTADDGMVTAELAPEGPRVRCFVGGR